MLHEKKKSKCTTLLVLTYASNYSQLATVICAPVVPQIQAKFHSQTLLVSIWELGKIVGPLLVAPLSELYGRLPMYHIGNVLLIAFSIGGALSTSVPMFITFHFISGIKRRLTRAEPGHSGRPLHYGAARPRHGYHGPDPNLWCSIWSAAI